MNKICFLILFSLSALIKVESKQISLHKIQVPSKKNGISFEQELKDEHLMRIDNINFSSQELANLYDLQYIGTIYLGSKQQEFRMIFDTGSSLMWVPGSDCNQSCHTKHIYDFRNSQTAEAENQRLIKIQYGKGQCEGIRGSELASLEKEGKLFRIPLLFVSQDSSMEGMQAEGIVGFSNDKSSDNFLEKAKQSGIINSSVFAFELSGQDIQSFFYYDDIPQEKLNGVVYVDAVDEIRWLVEVIGLYIDGEDMSNYSLSKGLVDTGTSYLYISKKLYQWLIDNYVSQVCEYVYQEFICPCNNELLNSQLPIFEFYLRGAIVLIPPTEYVIKQFGHCTLLVSYLPSYDFPILGDVFLRNHFTLFDKTNNKIGIGNVETLTNIHLYIVFLVFIPLFTALSFIALVFFFFYMKRAKKSIIQASQSSLHQSLLSQSRISLQQHSLSITSQDSNNRL